MAEASRQPLLADQTTEPDEASPSKSDVPSWTEEFIQIIKLCGPAVVQLCFQQARPAISTCSAFAFSSWRLRGSVMPVLAGHDRHESSHGWPPG